MPVSKKNPSKSSKSSKSASPKKQSSYAANREESRKAQPRWGKSGYGY